MKRVLLAVAGLLGVAGLVAAVVTTPSRGDPALARRPSAESAGGAGVGAAARWLEATGRPSRRLVAGGARPRAGEVWLLLAPEVALDEREVTALVEHASAGGLVVWALGGAGDGLQPALARRLLTRRVPASGDRAVGPLAPHPLFDGLSLRAGGAGVVSDHPGARAVLGDEERPAAVALPLGRGEVLLLAGPEPLDNRRIRAGDTLSLWVRLAARGPIAFDERFLRPAPGAGAAAGTPWLLGVQLAVAALLLAASLWPRLGTVRPPPPAGAPRTTRQYLASLAGLYQRAGAEPELAAASWGRLRRRLEREAGVVASLPAAEAAARLAARIPGAAEPLRRGEEALAQGGPGCLLAVAQAAADVEAARRGRGRAGSAW